jgi:hypothetical protein
MVDKFVAVSTVGAMEACDRARARACSLAARRARRSVALATAEFASTYVGVPW